jgi:hypothetical protein
MYSEGNYPIFVKVWKYSTGHHLYVLGAGSIQQDTRLYLLLLAVGSTLQYIHSLLFQSGSILLGIYPYLFENVSTMQDIHSFF